MMQQQPFEYFAACPKGLESLLLEELTAMGAQCCRETVAGVYFSGDIEMAYKACLWSRLANKILLPLAKISVDGGDDLYVGACKIPWREHLSPTGSLVVDFTGTNQTIRNTQFGALRIKDAVVDCLRDSDGNRPSVDKQNPDIRLNVRLNRGVAQVSLDLSGSSLHRRGYRTQQGIAPMKENLAAALLLRANWPAIAAEGGALLDPMCGSGTLLIEAAMMATDIAPGLERYFGFERWLQHDDNAWQSLLEQARQRRRIGLESEPIEIRGYDANLNVIRAAENNIIQAKLDDQIRVSRKELKDFVLPTHKTLKPGLVISNPPYGERLGDIESLKHLYAHFGERLKANFEGWKAAIFTGNPDLCRGTHLHSHKQYKFFNGTLPSTLLLFDIDPKNYIRVRDKAAEKSLQIGEEQLTEGARMLANRLKKNARQRAKWRKKESVSCYRLYDADMPEYSAAIDIYVDVDGNIYAHVQEYAAPKSIDEKSALKRFSEIQTAVPYALGLPSENISYKQRRRNRGRSQYEKMQPDSEHKPIVIEEGGVKLEVDLWRYIDTGLFLDHRPVRLKIAELAAGARFLNLFCYTATASVHAALAGARFTLSLDMSHTYLAWAKRNYALNGMSESVNRLEQGDCVEWLKKADQQFDLIMLDPPSFSNSKRMLDVLDIQRDHVTLIEQSMRLLAPGGTLIFSNNLRNFKLEIEALGDYHLQNYGSNSLDLDFQRNSKIHHCWLISHKTVLEG